MKWSIRLGKWLGIKVYLHFTFLLVMVFIAVSSWFSTGDLGASILSLAFFCALFLCVLLHEFGHALAARRYGIRTRDITLLPIGGLARLERLPERPLQELVVALAGPAVNVVIAAGLWLGLLLSGTWQHQALNGTEGSLLHRLLAVNVMLVLFNLLPAFPMDGGRVLRALLATRLHPNQATRIAAGVGKIMAIIFAMIGFFWSPILLFIAVFVWIGAAQESSLTHIKSGFSGACVRDAMVTRFRTLEPNETLDNAMQQFLAGAQRVFPVLENGRVLGILGQAELLSGLRAAGASARVADAMRREFDAIPADLLLDSLWERLQAIQGEDFAIPVFRDHQLVGMLTRENLEEFVSIRLALAGPKRPHSTMPPPLPRAQGVGG